jgi:ADP-heptose:LPS heptosyltransferase
MWPYYGQNYLKRFEENGGAGKLPYDIFEINNLRCRPCSKIGYDSCPQGHFKCMEKIDPAAVVARIRERLSAI